MQLSIHQVGVYYKRPRYGAGDESGSELRRKTFSSKDPEERLAEPADIHYILFSVGGTLHGYWTAVNTIDFCG